MTPDDRKALRDVLRCCQQLLPLSQQWYTQSTGDPGVPTAITDLRLALIAPTLNRLLRESHE